MKTTAAFLHASPGMKSEMITEGFLTVSAHLSKLASEVKVLNGWLAVMPAYIACGKAEKPDGDKLTSVVAQCASNTDDLTEQHIILAQKIQDLMDYMEKLQPVK